MYAFQNYGSTVVWPRIESYREWVSVAFFDTSSQTFTYSVYHRRHIFAEERSIKMNQMIGGVDEVLKPDFTLFLKSD